MVLYFNSRKPPLAIRGKTGHQPTVNKEDGIVAQGVGLLKGLTAQAAPAYAFA